MDIGTLLIILFSIIGLVISAANKNKNTNKKTEPAEERSGDESNWPFGGEAWKDLFENEPQETEEETSEEKEPQEKKPAEAVSGDNKKKDHNDTEKKYDLQRSKISQDKKNNYLDHLMKDFDLKKAVIYSEIINRKEF